MATFFGAAAFNGFATGAAFVGAAFLEAGLLAVAAFFTGLAVGFPPAREADVFAGFATVFFARGFAAVFFVTGCAAFLGLAAFLGVAFFAAFPPVRDADVFAALTGLLERVRLPLEECPPFGLFATAFCFFLAMVLTTDRGAAKGRQITFRRKYRGDSGQWRIAIFAAP
ncbi:MAG: hypothetical protein H6591_06150 [Flavobacteriales bacterium]|nr:hypothetical protein [Flavobacteriales bacterium]